MEGLIVAKGDINIKRLLRDSTPSELPLPDEDLVVFLEETFPPRCYDPRSEDLEAHLKYAGKVELIQAMRAALSNAEKEHTPPIPI